MDETRIIVVDLFGRMGNQLFQYFFGYAMSKKHKCRVLYRCNDLKIGHLGFPIEITTLNYPTINEKQFHYYEPPFKNYHVYTGYWQSQKYFVEYREDILKMFNFKLLLPEVTSVHVRRGDYLNLPNQHPVQSATYYIEGVEKVRGEGPIFVFSDDPQWCRDNFPREWKIMSSSDYTADFFMMASCPYHVISNSSFSWWAAWINGQRVTAPNNWLGPALHRHNTKDLLPSEWEKL